MLFDTPSWCDGALTITPPNVADVDDEVVVLLGCRSVAVEALFFGDIDVRCLCRLTDGVEGLNHDDVEVDLLGCIVDSLVALTPDDVADQ